MAKTIAEALSDFEEDYLMEELNKRLEEDGDPLELVRELQQGMEKTGERFDAGEYFLSDLMMSSLLFTKGMELLEPRLKGATQKNIGKIVIGTPRGDIHEIGKNIFCVMARGMGFEVHDLGVNVPAEQFIEAIEREKPQILGFSALLTTAFEAMKQVVEILTEKGLRKDLKIIVGGGVTTETVREFLGADGQTTDVMDGLNQCKAFVGQ